MRRKTGERCQHEPVGADRCVDAVVVSVVGQRSIRRTHEPGDHAVAAARGGAAEEARVVLGGSCGGGCTCADGRTIDCCCCRR